MHYRFLKVAYRLKLTWVLVSLLAHLSPFFSYMSSSLTMKFQSILAHEGCEILFQLSTLVYCSVYNEAGSPENNQLRTLVVF